MPSKACVIHPGTYKLHPSCVPARLDHQRVSKLVHEGVNPDKETGAILTPIVQSTTFIQDSVDKYLVREMTAEDCLPSCRISVVQAAAIASFVAWIACCHVLHAGS